LSNLFLMPISGIPINALPDTHSSPRLIGTTHVSLWRHLRVVARRSRVTLAITLHLPKLRKFNVVAILRANARVFLNPRSSVSALLILKPTVGRTLHSETKAFPTPVRVKRLLAFPEILSPLEFGLIHWIRALLEGPTKARIGRVCGRSL